MEKVVGSRSAARKPSCSRVPGPVPSATGPESISCFTKSLIGCMVGPPWNPSCGSAYRGPMAAQAPNVTLAKRAAPCVPDDTKPLADDLHRGGEDVAGPALGADELRLRARRRELPAKASDLGVDRAVV